jgi:hypothetical protein
MWDLYAVAPLFDGYRQFYGKAVSANHGRR